MNANLIVTDYMEAPLLLLGWIVNNTLWDTLMMTGLAAVPFVAMLVSEWYRARREGDDEGNKGKLALNRIETSLYAMVLCYAFTCLPLLGVSISPANNIVRLDASGNSCSVAVIGEGEWTSDTLNSLSGSTANIPLWWAFVHVLSKGMTNSAVASIPCTPDWQAIATEVDLQEVEDPILKQEVNEFQQSCYGAARNKLFREEPSVTDALLAKDVAWLGSQHLLTTPGYYDAFYAPRPIQGFPYVASRDQARSNTGPGLPGYPSCAEWWSDGTNGLRVRLYNEVDPGFWTSLSAVVSGRDAEELVLRRMISPREGAANGRHLRPVAGFRDIDGGNPLMAPIEMGSGLIGTIGGGMYVAKGKAGMDMLKMGLPMIQAVLVMAVIISLPLIITMSGYSFTVAGTATFGLFSIWFLTFWWELARWLSNNLITMLYGGGGSTTGALETAFGLSSLYDKSLLVIIEWAMFLVLPMIWMAVMAWAGFRTGSQISTQLSAGSKGIQSAGDKASSQAVGAATKGKLN